MCILRLFMAALLLPDLAIAQQHVSFSTQDGGVVHADVYGSGDRGLVLAHGGRFTKESWMEQMPAFLNAGFRVLAIDFRGRGQSRGPQSKSGEEGAEYDVLAAVRYLRKTGAKTVAIIGASFGGEAAADASIDAEPGEIDRLGFWLHGPTGLQKRSKVASCSSSRETTQTEKDFGYPGFVRTTRKLRDRKSCL